jgi:holo-[acyl-carrier protein] synthase
VLRLAVRVLAVDELPAPADSSWRRRLTPAELAYCTGLAQAGHHLAARAAGKQAVLAVLDAGDGDPDTVWPELEIRRAPGSAPRVVLHGRLEGWRRGRGLGVPGVSLSHAAGRAAALAWLDG